METAIEGGASKAHRYAAGKSSLQEEHELDLDGQDYTAGPQEMVEVKAQAWHKLWHRETNADVQALRARVEELRPLARMQAMQWPEFICEVVKASLLRFLAGTEVCGR